MNTPILRSGPLRRALLALVTAAVLCAQWVGVQHRVEHAGRSFALAIASANGQSGHEHPAASNEPAPWHDCAAFDHASLGAGPAAASPSCTPPPSTATRVADRSSIASAAPQALGYLSRAPPRV